MKKSEMSQVIIRAQGSEWNFPLDAKETIIVQGVLGNTIVRIDGEKSWVESSPCINQTCVATGKISKQGQWTACLPNNVLVMLMGNVDDKNREKNLAEEDIDAVAF